MRTSQVCADVTGQTQRVGESGCGSRWAWRHTLVPVQLAMRRAQLCGAGGLSSLVSQFGTSPEPNGRAACKMPRAFALQPLSPPALPQRVFPLFCFARPRRRDLLWRVPALVPRRAAGPEGKLEKIGKGQYSTSLFFKTSRVCL